MNAIPLTSLSSESSVPEGFKLMHDGLYSVRVDEDGNPKFDRICDWICVTATTLDQKGDGIGRLVEFNSVFGDQRKIVIDARRFASGSSGIIAELLSLGLRIERGPAMSGKLSPRLMQKVYAEAGGTGRRIGLLT